MEEDCGHWPDRRTERCLLPLARCPGSCESRHTESRTAPSRQRGNMRFQLAPLADQRPSRSHQSRNAAGRELVPGQGTAPAEVPIPSPPIRSLHLPRRQSGHPPGYAVTEAAQASFPIVESECETAAMAAVKVRVCLAMCTRHPKHVGRRIFVEHTGKNKKMIGQAIKITANRRVDVGSLLPQPVLPGVSLRERREQRRQRWCPQEG